MWGRKEEGKKRVRRDQSNGKKKKRKNEMLMESEMEKYGTPGVCVPQRDYRWHSELNQKVC